MTRAEPTTVVSLVSPTLKKNSKHEDEQSSG